MGIRCDHLDVSRQTYTEHLVFALNLACHLLCISIVCIVHAFIPWIFPGTTSNAIKHIGEKLKER